MLLKHEACGRGGVTTPPLRAALFWEKEYLAGIESSSLKDSLVRAEGELVVLATDGGASFGAVQIVRWLAGGDKGVHQGFGLEAQPSFSSSN